MLPHSRALAGVTRWAPRSGRSSSTTRNGPEIVTRVWKIDNAIEALVCGSQCATRAREMPAVTVRVSYRGKPYAVDLPSDASVRDLGAVLERATGASVSTQKLLGLKRASKVRAGTLVPGREEDASLLVTDIEGLCESAKPLMLMGTPAAAIAALDAAAGVDHRVRGFEEEALRERRRRKGHVGRSATAASGPGGRPRTNDPGPPSTSEHPYTFTEYRALPVPAVIRPPASAALRMLHRLARDPGILGIMRKHKWRVPLLAEMPPEGKVGVSESCVLGYNVNAGQEIHLRLRTDDLRGFRRYQRVRETLVHELTHNVWSAHDANFKNFCSQLTRECAAFDWKQSGHSTARTLGGADARSGSDDEETWSEDEAMAATRASSGSALGGGQKSDAAEADPRVAAGRAAARRAAENAEREMESFAREAVRRPPRAGGACACGACGLDAGPATCGACPE